MNSFMSWVGGKKSLRDAVLARFPPYYERYIEVFGGAGWVLFHKPPGNDFEVYNDFNSNLVNLYRCVRDNPNRLKYKLRYVLNSREDFEWIASLHKRGLLPKFRDYDRAAKFYQLIRYSYTLAQEAADFEASFDSAENRFQSAERSFNTWDLGSLRIQYRCNTRIGAFQIISENHSSYEHVPVFYFDTMIPYEFDSGNENLSGFRENEVKDLTASYVTVKEEKDSEGKITACTVIIPYNDTCIREIKLRASISDDSGKEVFYDLAERINNDRKVWIDRGIFDAERKNKMQIRNLGDTAAAALKVAVTGGNVEEAVKQGIDTANAIEEGKVKQGFFGKLFRK